MMKKALALFLCLTILVPVCPASADSEIPYKYDANGNLTSGDGKYFEYNDANKLVRVRQSDVNGPVLAEYVYDHAGQRIKKIENGVTTYYVGKLYEEEYTGGQQTGKASYYFANGQRVAKKDKTGKMLYFHADHLGGTNVVTDADGNQVERTKYYPFGDIREGGNERYSFTGKEKDKATDFYYFEARHYNPGYRHFTQADIIVPNPYDPQSLNRYAYVKNNPVKCIDPTGFDEESFMDSLKNKVKEKAHNLDEKYKITEKIQRGKEKIGILLSNGEQKIEESLVKVDEKMSSFEYYPEAEVEYSVISGNIKDGAGGTDISQNVGFKVNTDYKDGHIGIYSSTSVSKTISPSKELPKSFKDLINKSVTFSFTWNEKNAPEYQIGGRGIHAGFAKGGVVITLFDPEPALIIDMGEFGKSEKNW